MNDDVSHTLITEFNYEITFGLLCQFVWPGEWLREEVNAIAPILQSHVFDSG